MFRVLYFGFRSSSLGFTVSGFGVRFDGSGLQVSDYTSVLTAWKRNTGFASLFPSRVTVPALGSSVEGLGFGVEDVVVRALGSGTEPEAKLMALPER